MMPKDDQEKTRRERKLKEGATQMKTLTKMKTKKRK